MDPDARTNAVIARRLREIRERLHGPDGIPALAASLGLLAGTWANYERGVIAPGHIILRFLVVTGVNPHWLLLGEGDRFMPPPDAPVVRSRPEGAGRSQGP